MKHEIPHTINFVQSNFGLTFWIVGFPCLLLFVWLSYRVFRKSGRSGWWGLLMVIPVVNLVMVWVFAFMRWPVLDPPETKGVED